MSSSKAGDEYAAASSSKSEYYFDLEFEKSRKLSKNPKKKTDKKKRENGIEGSFSRVYKSKK